MVDVEYIGQRLIERGFRTYFLYMFQIVEGRRFIIEPLHERLFQYYEDILEGRKTRVNINICPRSAKTTFSKFFVSYVFTICPNAQIIYTSFSQSLLAEISSQIAGILEHPVYKAMYPNKRIMTEETETAAIDDFWRDYLFKEDKGNKYSSKLIKTFAGGVCLFSAIGSQITGFGAGVRNSKKFSGFLVIDDGNKPADIHSAKLREKAVRYYEDTLLNRLNNPNTPIINIQQRLHLEDLSGVLQEKYNFETLKVPLLNDDGACNLPHQYTKERITELQKNNYVFSAQFQQEPIILGGAVIKRAWFRYYDANMQYSYKRLLIAADTAMKVKEHNDFSVFLVGGITTDDKLHVLEMVRGKWEAPDLKRIAVELFDRYKFNPKTGVSCSGLYVEDKASGIGLIQELQREGVPIVGMAVDKDKLTRIENVLPYIESGQVLLPNSEIYGFNPELLAECEAFTRDDSHSHDDICDALAYLIQQALVKNKVGILDFYIS